MSKGSTRSVATSGPATTIMVSCSAGRTAGRRTPTRSRAGSSVCPRQRPAGDRPSRRRHSYATVGRDARIDWKALSKRIGRADVAFTMKQCVQTDLEADRQVANTLAELIIGGSLASAEITSESREGHAATADGDSGEAA